MNKTVYLIAALSKDGKVIGYDIFSEPNPTQNLNFVLATVTSVKRETFSEAKTALVKYAAEFYPWMRIHRA